MTAENRWFGFNLKFVNYNLELGFSTTENTFIFFDRGAMTHQELLDYYLKNTGVGTYLEFFPSHTKMYLILR